MALGLIVFYFFLHKWSRQTTLYQTLDEDNNNDNNQSLDDQSLSHPTPQGAPVNTPPRTSRPETYTEMTREEILEYSKTPISFLIIGAFVVIYATAVGMTWGIPSPACIRPDERVVSVLLSGSCLATMLCLPFLIYIFVDEENNSYMESICCPHAAPWLWMIVPLIIIATPIFLPFSFFLLGWLIYKRVTYRRNNWFVFIRKHFGAFHAMHFIQYCWQIHDWRWRLSADSIVKKKNWFYLRIMIWSMIHWVSTWWLDHDLFWGGMGAFSNERTGPKKIHLKNDS